MKNAAYKKIFISYRVQDTAGETGRLVDALKQYFTDEQIFLDIENLEPGADFTEAIEHSLDSCDVFLAVIGPQWLGERGNDRRILDPNDWVRLEVATALQRNIRVVPVLVDGGALPPAEQLPTDLQPLLRRQAIEISNKRWRYDTEQLIQFLIQKAGIEPLRAAQKAVAPPAEPRKRKTWVYVSAGFALAFVVLIVIGLLVPEESTVNGTSTTIEQHSNAQPGASSLNESGVAELSGSENHPTSGYEEPEQAAATVTGRWKEVDEGITSTFVLKQNGSNINVQVELNGQVIGSGTGTINNKKVQLNFPLLGFPTILVATLSADNNTMNGTYTMQATGEEQPIQLVRKNF
jgi:hypothetical protein